MLKTDLSTYNNQWYKPGSTVKRGLWYITNVLLFQNPLNPFSGVKIFFLKLFGAKIGQGVVIKPSVNIKYPWKLEIGNYSWIGENVWIDNLAKVTIGSNCCLSQGSLLLCGNHNFAISSFDLMVHEITLEDGVWIGAQATVTPGTTCESHSLLTVKSVTSGNLEAYGIYKGNPAQKIKTRKIYK